MTLDRGRNVNKNDATALSPAIPLNSTTSTTIQATNDVRIFFAISNQSNKRVWLKLQAAGVDNDKKGIFLPANSYWEMPTDNIYTGEICAIAVSGTPDVYTTEY